MLNKLKQSESEDVCSLQFTHELVQGTQSYLTVKEVAEVLKVSRDTVYRLLEKRDIPFYQFGGCRRIATSDLKQYLNSCLVQAQK